MLILMKVEVAIEISDQVVFRAKNITRNKEDCFIMIERNS